MTTTAEPEGGPSAGRRRRRRWTLGVVVALAVASSAGVVAFTRMATPPPVQASSTPAPSTAQVARKDLTDRIKVDGDLGNGQTREVTGRKPGTLTKVPAPGSVIDRGGVLYEVDAIGIPLLLGGVPLYRELAEKVPTGDDVVQLQENLIALGYTEVGKADGKFGAGTTKAIKRWQKERKAEQTGKVAPGDVVVLPGPVRVSSVTAQLGAPADGPVLMVTGTERLVTVELTDAQKRLAKQDAKVSVLYGEDKATPGTVRELGVKPSDDGKTSKAIATISLDDGALAATLEPGHVTVQFDGEQRKGVLAVPVQALLALREGGYALEVVDGETRKLLAVKTGMFAEGLVEVSGEGLVEGMRVVTTS